MYRIFRKVSDSNESSRSKRMSSAASTSKKEKIDKLLREQEAKQRKVVSDSDTLSMRIEQNLDELSRIRESLKKNTDALASLTHDCKKV